jgi:hypothetical protein
MVVAVKEVTVKEREEPEEREARTVRGRTRAGLGAYTHTSPHPIDISLKLVNAPESLISILVISLAREPDIEAENHQEEAPW